MGTKKIKYPLLILAVMVTALLFAAAIARLRIDTDVAAGLPNNDGVLADAVYIFKNHPIQNEIAIDIALEPQDRDLLVQVANQVEERLLDSGLFTRVGMDDMQQIFPRLIGHVAQHLPLLFSARDLNEQIAPLISPQAVDDKFKALQQSLARFDSIVSQ